MKQVRREQILVDVDGKTYEGYCTIEGTKKLFQTVHYNSRTRFDSRAYKPSEDTLMRHFAKVLLGELVRESK